MDGGAGLALPARRTAPVRGRAGLKPAPTFRLCVPVNCAFPATPVQTPVSDI
ncbi:MAG: hypothetical protein LBM98_02765 [Oscillospiraceae bacterium]|nr:hypothetical protein [Oscillospiraceae bacterium]